MKQLVLAITFIIALLIFILLAPIDEAISQTRQKKIYERLAKQHDEKISGEGKKFELILKYSDKFYDVLKPISARRNAKEMQRKILEAGLDGRVGADQIFGMQAMCAFFVFVLYFLMTAAGGFQPLMVGLLIAASAVAYLLPEYTLIQKGKIRREKLTHEIPFVLNTLAILTNAGLSLYEAICKVSCETGTMAEELRRVVDEVEVGTSLKQALSDSSERCDNREYSSFTFSICQSMEKGSEGVALEMRRLSDEAWKRRINRAKEAGSKMSTKLLFPMLLFSFPAMLIIILGPALISLMKIL